jgi:predicted DNA-binding transcriptional regulator AlpA
MSITLNLPPEIAGKRVLTTRESAALLGLSVRDLERKRAAGEMPPAVQLGTRKLGYTLESLLSWIASRTESQEAAA